VTIVGGKGHLRVHVAYVRSPSTAVERACPPTAGRSWTAAPRDGNHEDVPHIELPELPGIVGLLVQYPQTAGPLNGLADALLRGPSPLSPADRETIAAYVSARNECTFCAETHGAVARHMHAAQAGASHRHVHAAHGDTAETRTGAAGAATADTRTAEAGSADNRTAGAATADTRTAEAGSADNRTAEAGTVDAGIVDAVIAHGARADVGPKLQALLAIAEKVRVDGRSVSAADIARAREAGADDKAIHDTVLIAAAFCMFNRYVDGLATLTPDRPEAYAQHAKNLAEGGYLQEG
jgi:AhpD family alkylhydroperoxidase